MNEFHVASEPFAPSQNGRMIIRPTIGESHARSGRLAPYGDGQDR